VAHNNITGKRYVDHWREAGFECETPIKNTGAGAAMMRIEAARRIFPRCWFDEKATEGGASRATRSRRSPYRYHAEPGIKVYMDVQDQVVWPSGKGAKFSYGSCRNRNAGFNFNPQVVAVAEEMLLHRL
jgi:hypothetical protein